MSNLSEEEKKAIEILKDFSENEDTAYCYDWNGFDYEVILEAITEVLNLIEKQQKEIETLETLLQGNLYEMYKYYKGLANSYQANCISKDKIREKIEEYNLALSKNQTKYTLSKMQEIEFAIISMGELLQEGDK